MVYITGTLLVTENFEGYWSEMYGVGTMWFAITPVAVEVTFIIPASVSYLGCQNIFL